MGGVKCEDRCNQIGKEFRKKDEARQKSLTNAGKKRKDMIAEAVKIKKQVEDRIQSLGTEIQGAEVKVKALQNELTEVQKKDKGKVVKVAAGSRGGKLSVLVGLTRERIDELKDNLIRVRDERDASRSRLQELEDILTTFKEEYNPNFNDEGVKRAVRAWEGYAARDKGSEAQVALDRDMEGIIKSDEENGIVWEDYEEEGEGGDTDVCKCHCSMSRFDSLLTIRSVRLRKLFTTVPTRLGRLQATGPESHPHRRRYLSRHNWL